jgi:hypothetical protein
VIVAVAPAIATSGMAGSSKAAPATSTCTRSVRPAIGLGSSSSASAVAARSSSAHGRHATGASQPRQPSALSGGGPSAPASGTCSSGPPLHARTPRIATTGQRMRSR